MGYYKDGAGKRHAIYDRDPKRLYDKILDNETPTRTVLSDVLDLWEEAHKKDVKDRTWTNYAPHIADIKSIYGGIPIEEVSAFTVTQDLQAQKAKGYSYTIVNTRRCIWRMALDYAVADKNIQLPFNPALSVKNPKGLPKGKRSAPSDEILMQILSDSDKSDTGFIAFFLLCTGLRRSEALHRKKADVDTENWQINIPVSKTDAGVRTVPIIEPLRAPLVKWMDAHPCNYLFPHIDYYAGRQTDIPYMSDRNWETAWKNYCVKNGWLDERGKPSLGAHNLRHGTATLLFESGVDVYTAQHILGHAKVTTTMEIYTELREKQKYKNLAKYSRSLSKLLSKASKPLRMRTS